MKERNKTRQNKWGISEKNSCLKESLVGFSFKRYLRLICSLFWTAFYSQNLHNSKIITNIAP
jgi:hypothetical protein